MPDAQYDSIIDALRRGAADEAIAAGRDAVAAAPGDFTAHRLLSSALRLGGDNAAALASIDSAIELAPDEAVLYLERGQLLVRTRQLDAAEIALAQGVGLDPNQFPSYILQAQMALGREDLDEAERVMRLAARVAPQHPHVNAVEGMLALLRGEGEDAISILSEAVARNPDDIQLLSSLGFAHLSEGHLAFAEQTLRRVLERMPEQHGIRAQIAQLLLRQGRLDETMAELKPLLAADPVIPGALRLAGEVNMASGNAGDALPYLRAALTRNPGDRRTLLVTLEAWQRLGATEDARKLLDTLAGASPQIDDLWRARVAIEPTASEGRREVVNRWMQARPEYLPALEAVMAAEELKGDRDAISAVAERIIAIAPDHVNARLRLIGFVSGNDPAAALEQLQQLFTDTQSVQERRAIRYPLALALDRAGDAGAAVQSWLMQGTAVAVPRLLPPPPCEPRSDWPELAQAPESAHAIGFLWGAPGSVVEDVVVTGMAMGLPFLSDRFSRKAPTDALQRSDTAARLVKDALQPQVVVASWRDALADRGVADRGFIDWLPWWDNQLLVALRPHMPEALVLFALRDPRDMLLDWLAFGAPSGLAFESPTAAAGWLATMLEQIAAVHEQDLFPHRLLPLDDVLDDPQALAGVINQALQTQVPPPSRAALGPQRLQPGRWRHYADALAEPFGQLASVAQRLGYQA